MFALVAARRQGRDFKESGALSLMTFAALFVTKKRDKRKVTLCLFIKKLLIRHAPRATFLAAARSRSGSDSPRAVIHSPRAASLPAGEGSSSAFSFAYAGAKEKAIKKKTPKEDFALCGARPPTPAARASL